MNVGAFRAEAGGGGLHAMLLWSGMMVPWVFRKNSVSFGVEVICAPSQESDVCRVGR